MAEAGERPRLPALPSHTPETKPHHRHQDSPTGQTGLGLTPRRHDSPAGRTGLGLTPQRVAEEGRKANFYSVGAVIVFFCQDADWTSRLPFLVF